MIKAIIVDDEKNAITNLQWEIEEYCDNIEIIGTFSDPLLAVKKIDELKPNCLFLDIQMPGLDGFQLLHKLKHKNFNLIFTTAYENYAIKAFKEDAIDYLLKPIDIDELKFALKKVKLNIKNEEKVNVGIDSLIEKLKQKKSTKISLSVENRIIILDKSEILYCKSDGNYSYLFLENGSNIFITKKIKKLELLLNSKNFLRVHNSYLVNMNKVTEYYKGDGGELLMTNGHSIPVSRSKKQDLLLMLNK